MGPVIGGFDLMPDTTQLATYARILRLTPVEDAALPQSVAEVSPEASSNRKKSWREGLISFLVLVVLPTAAAVVYFGGLAADRYQSEARFVLRMPGRSVANIAIANLVPQQGITRSNDDGYVVQEFLESRDAMQWLKNEARLEAAYDEPLLDFIWRFPNFYMSHTDEGLYRQYRRMMSAEFDTNTGVSTLKVQAFSSATAQRLTLALLDIAEALVNRLNERANRDAISLAETEVNGMRERTLAAQAALTSFRERERLIDPSQVTLAVLDTIAKLAQEAAQISVQIGELSQTSPSGPQLLPLRSRQAAVEKQISIERQRLAGDSASIAPRIAEYERLTLEREFAEKALMTAMASVETARVEALRQQVYLERVATPSSPDYATYPWRIVWSLVVAVVGFLGWRIWRILSADILRHVED